MNHNGTEPHDSCTVTVSVDERDGRTRATARLRLGAKESIGVGLSRLAPSEHSAAGIGRDLAIARALSDLSRRMMAVAANDIEALTSTTVTPAR